MEYIIELYRIDETRNYISMPYTTFDHSIIADSIFYYIICCPAVLRFRELFNTPSVKYCIRQLYYIVYLLPIQKYICPCYLDSEEEELGRRTTISIMKSFGSLEFR